MSCLVTTMARGQCKLGDLHRSIDRNGIFNHGRHINILSSYGMVSSLLPRYLGIPSRHLREPGAVSATGGCRHPKLMYRPLQHFMHHHSSHDLMSSMFLLRCTSQELQVRLDHHYSAPTNDVIFCEPRASLTAMRITAECEERITC